MGGVNEDWFVIVLVVLFLGAGLLVNLGDLFDKPRHRR